MSVAAKLLGGEIAERPVKRRQFIKDLSRDFAAGMALSSPLRYISPQYENWFTYGDMYDYRNRKTPLEIYVCDDRSAPEELRIYTEHEKFRGDRLTDQFMETWTKQANGYLDYLSGGQFRLEPTEIKRIKMNYLNDEIDEVPWPPDGKSFRMVVHPTIPRGGFYGRRGFLWVRSFHMQLDEGGKRTFDSLPLHEIFHGFFGGKHSDSPESMMNLVTVMGLTKPEARHLGWPAVEPVDVHPWRYKIINEDSGDGYKRRLEFYRD